MKTRFDARTPGNWISSPAGYGKWIWRGGYRGTIVSDRDVKIYAGPASFNALRASTPQQAEANAALMAAAPELLRLVIGYYEAEENWGLYVTPEEVEILLAPIPTRRPDHDFLPSDTEG